MEKKNPDPKQRKSTTNVSGHKTTTRPDILESAWKLISLLREETLSTQRIRAQVIGIKITTITLGLGFILDKGVHPVVYIVVAYAAVLFDFLIASYSIAIKRSGYYIRTELEQKIIRKYSGWPNDVLLWEEFMTDQKSTQMFSTYGNLGLTLLASILAFASPFMPVNPEHFQFPGMIYLFCIMLLVLGVLLYHDFRAHLKPRKIFVHGV